jgi:hypothetical protein
VKGKVAEVRARLRGKDTRTPDQRRAALTTAMQHAQRLLKQPTMTTGAISKALVKIKKEFRVRRLEVVVDERSATSETVHVVGANSPTVEGPRVTRPVPVLQKADEDEVTATGDPTTIQLGEDVFTVWQLGDKTVRVRIEQGDEQELPANVSAEEAVRRLTGGELLMEVAQARKLVDALADRGLLTRQLLLQYVSNATHGMEPEDFAAFLSMQHLGTRASISKPVGKTARELLVDKGTTTEGEQRQSPLTSIAQVFYPRRMGEWRSGQIQKTGGEGSKGIEFKFVEGSQQEQKTNPRGLPTVISLGVVEVDDNGVIVRILSATPQAGGVEGLKKIMETAKWSMRLPAQEQT